MAGLNTKIREGRRPSHHASTPSWHAMYHRQSVNTAIKQLCLCTSAIMGTRSSWFL